MDPKDREDEDSPAEQKEEEAAYLVRRLEVEEAAKKLAAELKKAEAEAATEEVRRK